MNTKNLTTNQKMLAIIIGVAIFAAAGVSTASAQTTGSTGQTSTPPKIQGSINIEQQLLSNVKVDFTSAATTAAGAIINGKIIGGSLTQAQGYLVYDFKVIDDKNMIYSVIVDPSTGAVLNTSQGHSFQMGGFAGHGSMKHGHGMGANTWKNKAPSVGTTPSGSIAPSSDLAQNGLQ